MTAVLNLVDSIINMETGPLSLKDELYYKGAGKFLLRAIVYYVCLECTQINISEDVEKQIVEKDFLRVQELLNEAKVNDDGISLMDVRMELLNKTTPEHPAYLNYKKFKKVSFKIQNEIIDVIWGQLMWWNAHKNIRKEQ